MNPVVHFEIPADDKKRMVEFYTTVFGWQVNMLGPEMGEYVVVTTTETDEKTGRPKTPGAINGGFYLRSADEFSRHPSVVVAVDDIRESIEKVKAAGGTLHGGVYEILGVGQYISIVDTEGNRVSLLQPNPRMGKE